MAPFERIIWIVLDSVGIGALPDAADYDDVGRDTLGHIAKSRPLALPNLLRLGLANIAPLPHHFGSRPAVYLFSPKTGPLRFAIRTFRLIESANRTGD